MEQQGKYISALDIGTSKVIALIGEVQEDNEIHIVGLGQAPSRGLKAGMVTNIDATAQAIRQAVNEAELMADTKISHVTTGIAGNHIRSLNSQGVVKIKDGEVSQADIDRAIETAKAVNIPPDHNILHTVVQEYIIDNQPGVNERCAFGYPRPYYHRCNYRVAEYPKMYPSLRPANGSDYVAASGQRAGGFNRR